MKPSFFKTPAELRTWFEANNATSSELWVGLHKSNSRRRGIGYPEALDEALCFGWIDGVRKSLGPDSYVIRFSPRRAHSIWSLVNIRRARELTALGKMQPSGLKAFLERDERKTRLYSFEQQKVRLAPKYIKEFKANEKAWSFFSSQAPSYRKTATWYVLSAKKEETRLRRLGAIMKASRQRKRFADFLGKK
jgi:uncharacterized protein YdeI (YjbR/CyaY-like superfamily)